MRTNNTHLYFYGMIILLFATIMLTGCFVPTNEYLMKLNRNGKWGEAERLGQSMLDHQDTFTHAEVCETYFHVIYARTRLGKTGEAIELMTRYDEESQKKLLPVTVSWLHREIAMLKDELGLLTNTQKTLVQAMEENGSGNYQRAIELCSEVLASSECTEVQQAVAHLVSAVCFIRLKDVRQAEAHMEIFEELKTALPPGHVALQEIEYVHKGLADL